MGIEPVCVVLEFPVSSYYHAKKREAELAAREKGDSYDNAAAEALNSLYKREVIDPKKD